MSKLKKGEAVIVRLSETHELTDDNAVDHKAKFVQQNDDKWAIVELEQEHAGGTKMLTVPMDAIVKAQDDGAAPAHA